MSVANIYPCKIITNVGPMIQLNEASRFINVGAPVAINMTENVGLHIEIDSQHKDNPLNLYDI